MFVSSCVVLDATMTVSEVIARLARQGYWLDAAHPTVRQQIEESAARLKLSVENIEQKLARPSFLVGAAIRRQWYASIIWYARPVYYVLANCHQAASDELLLVALGLQETDGMPALDVPTEGEVPQQEGVIVDGEMPVAVSLDDWGAPTMEDLTKDKIVDMGGYVQPMRSSDSIMWTVKFRNGNIKRFKFPIRTTAEGSIKPYEGKVDNLEDEMPVATVSVEKDVRAWPRIDAPAYVPARKPFFVTVGLDLKQQAGVTGGKVVIHPPNGARTIDVEVMLIADGLNAPDGWSRTMSVHVDNPTAAEVKFQLVGLDPPGPEPAHLATLELRYSYGGSICGTASRPLVIGRADAQAYDLPEGYGKRWLDQPTTTSSMSLLVDPDVADLTIEIFKPDGNPAKGSYACRLYSPHALACEMGPFRIELDDDAQSFAKAIVHQVRTYANSPAVDNLLKSHGQLIADKLGAGVIAALREVAKRVASATPAVLLVSAEPYVPWELAYIDPPLDAQRPQYLGAQVLLGRWLRDRLGPRQPPGTNCHADVVTEKPPVQPPSRIEVKHMAVMAGMYKAKSGLRSLPKAEAEATTLQQTYEAVPLAASLEAVKQLLDASIEHKSESIGGVETIHFAGHGDYDTSNPDSAVLFLSDGRPLFASLFRSAKYGGKQSPLFFLNACMAGIGDELLGNMGGFPGNCLKGGFGGVLGALWEVDDEVAHDLALEFWQRALPLGGAKGEPVGGILRDLRAKYVPDPATAPVTTYLSYVFYGHPRLTLQMTR